VSELLRHLVSGQITNDEFEDRLPEGSPDRAVTEIASECKRSPRTALFLLARERRFIIRAEGASGLRR
jgi:hypothetical protein